MLSAMNIVTANTLTNRTAYRKLIINGFIPLKDREENTYPGRAVSVVLKNKDRLVYADEKEIDNDGNYRLVIGLDDGCEAEDCTLSVKIGNKNAQSTVVSAAAVDESLVNVPVSSEAANGQTKLSADLTEVAEMTGGNYKIILAAYDGGALKRTEFITDSVERDGDFSCLEYTLDGEYSEVKLFIWSSIESMLPTAVTVNGAISFGKQYTVQEINGYKNLEELTAENYFKMNTANAGEWTNQYYKKVSEYGVSVKAEADGNGDYALAEYPAEMSDSVLVNLRKYGGETLSHKNKRMRFEYALKIPDCDEVINKTVMSFTTGGATYEKINLAVRNDVTEGKTGLYFATRKQGNGWEWVYTPIAEENIFDNWIKVKFDVDFLSQSMRIYDGCRLIREISLKSHHEDLSVKESDDLLYFGLCFKNTSNLPVTFGIRDFKISGISADENSTYGRYIAAKAEISDEADLVKLPYVNSKINIYVSPNGNKNGDGSFENPYGSIGEAIDSVKNFSGENKKAWKTIYLREGDYYLNETVKLDESIAADGDARLVIKPYNNEKVSFTNAKIISGSSFKKVTKENTKPEEYKRLNSSAADNLYYCDYESFGCTAVDDFADGSPGKTPTLEYNGVNANISRFPNEGSGEAEGTFGGEVHISEIIESGAAAANEETPQKPVFVPTDTRFTTWKNPDGKIGIYGQLCVSWSVNSSFAEIDKENKTVTLPAGMWGWRNTNSYSGISQNVGYDPPVPSHFYYYNILEETDIPYEWCAEDSQQRLYFYPPNGEMHDTDVIKIRTNNDFDSLFTVDSVKNVIFDGVNFEGAGTAVSINGSSGVIVNGALIRNAARGLKITDSEKCGIINSELQNLSTGVSVADSKESFALLKPSRNFVQNNHFNGVRNGITLESNGCVISHNLAENYEATMIFVTAGCENIIEYNESVAGCQKGEEGGIIYVGGQYNCRHNHIRYNYLHNNEIPGEKKKLAGAVVLDDLGEDEYVYGNVIESVKAGIGSNGGDNHVIDSNFVADTDKAITAAGQYTNLYNNMYKNNLTNYFMNGNLQKSQYLKHYYGMGLQNSDAWNARYSYLPEKLAWYEHIAKLWGDNSYESNDDVKFFVNQTGLVVTDNVAAASKKDYEYQLSDYCDEVDVKNGEKPHKYGSGNLEYNVMYNNETVSDYNIKTVLSQKLKDSFGLKDLSPKYAEKDSVIKITHEPGKDGVLNGNKLTLSWLARSDANYYKVTVATDSDFKNTAAEYKTLKSGCEIDLGTDGTYYYKIEGISMKAYNFGEVTSSSHEK